MSEIVFPVSEKENEFLTLTHKKPAYLGTVVNNIHPREILDNIARGYVRDTTAFDVEKDAGGKDMFGVEWVYEPTAGGSMVVPGHPMLEDICEWEEKITWPNLDDIDWDAVAERVAPLVSNDKMNMTIIFTGYFERLISLLDFEMAAMTMIDEDSEDDLHAFFGKLTDYYVDLVHRLHKYCKLDVITFHDDWGHQHSSFYSKATCEEKILPYLTRVVEAAHEDGMLFVLHSCGKIENLVPLIVKAGVDKWDGQKINDMWAVLDTYGDKLVPNYTVKPASDSDEDINAWVDEMLAHLTPDSGKNIFVPVGKLSPKAKKILADRSIEFYK